MEPTNTGFDLGSLGRRDTPTRRALEPSDQLPFRQVHRQIRALSLVAPIIRFTQSYGAQDSDGRVLSPQYPMRSRVLFCITVVTVLTACQAAPPLRPVSYEPPDVSIGPEADFHSTELDDRPLPVAAPPETSFLDRLTAGFVLDHFPDHERVRQELNWLKRNGDFFLKKEERVARYLTFICDRVLAEGMPGEICLLPIVESALNPFAFSPDGAVGLWQFMPRTARSFDLKTDWWVDERRDVVAATEAALDYLDYLYKRFEDWPLAIAAYNWGEGRVSRALRRQGRPSSIFDMKLPRETAYHLARLYAYAIVFNDPQKVGVELPEAMTRVDEPTFVVVEIPGPIDVAKAADVVDIDLETLYAFNPALNQWATHPAGPHRIILPASKRDEAGRLTGLAPDQRLVTTPYVVAAGDTLSSIATRFDTDANAVRGANRLNSRALRIGSTIHVPTPSLAIDAYPSPSHLGISRQVYVVKRGDSLWTIGRRLGIGMNDLMLANQLTSKSVLQIGQELVLPNRRTVREVVSQAQEEVVNYRVRSGDSLSTIAKRFRVSVASIAQWNAIDPKGLIHPGQQLVLHVGGG